MERHWKDISDRFRRISLSEQTSSGWAIVYICSVKLSSVDIVRSLGEWAFLYIKDFDNNIVISFRKFIY